MRTVLADLELGRIFASLALVVLAGVLARVQRVGLINELVWASVRAFIQLIAVGYALQLIFDADTMWWTLLVLATMTGVAAFTSAGRARGVPGARAVTFAAIGTALVLTVGLMVVLGVFDFTPRYIIPLGGMVTGNAMTTCSLVMARLRDDFVDGREHVETALALGASGSCAARPVVRRSVRQALVPIIDTTRTVGLIKLPGAMTGMIMAGASPLDAVQLQLIIMYVLVGGTAVSALVAAALTSRRFFTPQHQLVVPDTARQRMT